MATTPVLSNFQPHFKRVSQGDDRHADLLAVIATLCGKQINEVGTQAEAVGIPKTALTTSTSSMAPPWQKFSRISAGSPQFGKIARATRT